MEPAVTTNLTAQSIGDAVDPLLPMRLFRWSDDHSLLLFAGLWFGGDVWMDRYTLRPAKRHTWLVGDQASIRTRFFTQQNPMLSNGS